MAIETEKIQALREAIATGAKSIQVGSTLITYRSMDEMERALAFAESQAETQSSGSVERVFRPVTSSGL